MSYESFATITDQRGNTVSTTPFNRLQDQEPMIQLSVDDQYLAGGQTSKAFLTQVEVRELLDVLSGWLVDLRSIR